MNRPAALVAAGFGGIAAERLLGSMRTQKTFDRASQGLSIGVHLNKIPFKSNEIIIIDKKNVEKIQISFAYSGAISINVLTKSSRHWTNLVKGHSPNK